jgi:hypothetical protein
MNARVASSLLALGLATLSSSALAFPGLDIGVGVVGLAGGSIIDKASESDPASQAYPGFAGTRVGVGGVVEARFLGIVGIEAGYVVSTDKGEGDVSLLGKSIAASLGQTASHIPVMVKLVAPIPVFAPFVAAGIDFVKPGSCESSLKLEGVTVPTTCYNDSYSMWTGALGAEISLPFLDFIRFPISLRGSAHRDFGDGIADRASFTFDPATGKVPTSANLRSEWRYDVYGTVGASLFF